jgi:hypothetical protein
MNLKVIEWQENITRRCISDNMTIWNDAGSYRFFDLLGERPKTADRGGLKIRVLLILCPSPLYC